MLSLPVAITASKPERVPLVNSILFLKPGFRSQRISPANLIRSSSLELVFAIILLPVIRTDRKSWNPTRGILPAIIIPTFIGLISFARAGYMAVHLTRFSWVNSSAIAFKAILTLSGVNHGFFWCWVSIKLFNAGECFVDSPARESLRIDPSLEKAFMRSCKFIAC